MEIGAMRQLRNDGVRGGGLVSDGSVEFDRILVVEDDDFASSLLVQLLASQGYRRVEVAADGRRALDRLGLGDIDLVLLDIEMPQLDGIEVLRRLKDDAGLSGIPVIVISAVEGVASIVRCIDLGAEDYLTKPFNPVILRSRIGASLEKHRLRNLEAARLAQILEEQQKIDRLLNVILPAAAAQELKSSGMVAPRRHEQVAVLFCDIVGFTAYCDRHPAEDVVTRLQLLIERFECVTERHRHVQSETPLFALREMAGWETECTVRRYAHLSGKHLAPLSPWIDFASLRSASESGRIWFLPLLGCVASAGNLRRRRQASHRTALLP